MGEILERAWFAYSRKAMPDVLEQRGWGCAEAGALSCWITILKERQSSTEALANAYELEETFGLMQTIHTILLHRNLIDIGKVKNMIGQSVRLVSILEQAEAIKGMVGILTKVVESLITLETEVRSLREREAAVMREVKGRRAELCRKEREAKEERKRKSADLEKIAGKGILESLGLARVGMRC
jgi:hypothetical protein